MHEVERPLRERLGEQVVEYFEAGKKMSLFLDCNDYLNRIPQLRRNPGGRIFPPTRVPPRVRKHRELTDREVALIYEKGIENFGSATEAIKGDGRTIEITSVDYLHIINQSITDGLYGTNYDENAI